MALAEAWRLAWRWPGVGAWACVGGRLRLRHVWGKARMPLVSPEASVLRTKCMGIHCGQAAISAPPQNVVEPPGSKRHWDIPLRQRVCMRIRRRGLCRNCNRPTAKLGSIESPSSKQREELCMRIHTCLSRFQQRVCEMRGKSRSCPGAVTTTARTGCVDGFGSVAAEWK